MNKIYDSIELQDLAKGYVVIKENNETIIEGFNTIVNTGRSFILSKIAKSAFNAVLEPPTEGGNVTDYSDYKFYKAYLCEASITNADTATTTPAPITSQNDLLSNYSAFIERAQGSNFEKSITAANTMYDIENRDLIIKFDISGDYSDAESRVISSIILTIANNNQGEAMFSRFTFDPKVITGNALIQINYHIHF